jgi:hypothetical protein
MDIRLQKKDKDWQAIIRRMLANNETALIVDGDNKPLLKAYLVPRPIGRKGRFPVYRPKDVQYLEISSAKGI